MTRGRDVANRLWRARADVVRRVRRAGSAASPERAFDRSAGADADWYATSAERFDRYRQANPPVAERCAIVCVSQRPDLIADVVANVARQAPLIDVDFVFVTNHDGFGDVDVDRHLADLPGTTVIERTPDASLGSCLNAGLAATTERFVAKFDDDDWYGRWYLADALRAHGYAGAGVVGKHSYYAEVGEARGRYLRFPGHEFAYSGTLAGGTLVIDRERVGGIEFDDVSLGEDRRFIAACHRQGGSTFSADRFGFVQRRDGRNTWSVDDEQFLVGCAAVDPADPVHDVDR